MPKKFSETLCHKPNAFLHALEMIRKHKEPVVLYGSQVLASRLLDFMTQFGVEVAHIVIDRQYLVPGMNLAGRPVEALENLPQTERYHYVVGFQPRDIASIRTRLLPSAASILLYDAGYGIPSEGLRIPYYDDDFFVQHKDRLNTLAECLADDLSRKSLKHFFEQRISGEIGLYSEVYQPEHYFPAGIVDLHPDSVLVDCGAYNGDTIAAFLQVIQQNNSSYSHIHAFEPDPENFLALQKACSCLQNCNLYQKGVWSEPGLCGMSGDASNASIIENAENSIVLDSIDNVLQGAKASLIKMDIEGAELQALRGAAHTIQQHKPQLAISVYHKILDIFDIPEYILSLHPDYRLYIRAHTPFITHELVLYAV